MSRAPDPTVRAALVETAAQILATEGPGRLSIRRLTRAVGTSTMAVYTHFGGMDDLRIAVCTEGFHRLATHLGSVVHTADPVADLIALGDAYATNARENPNLYRAMFLDRLPGRTPIVVDPAPGATRFGADAPREAIEGDPLEDHAVAELSLEAQATFQVLVIAVRRCIDAGRFSDDDAERLATELWGAMHGVVALELAGMLKHDRAVEVLRLLTRHLYVGFGGDPEAIDASIAEGLAAREAS